MELTSLSYAQWSLLFWGLYLLLASIRALIVRDFNPIPEIAWSWVAVFIGAGFVVLPYFWTADVWWLGEMINLTGIGIAIFDLRFYYLLPTISRRFRRIRSQTELVLGGLLLLTTWIIQT